MVQIIAGAKGKGKTKYLLDMANTAVKEAKGSVVYLDKSSKHMYELNNQIRRFETRTRSAFQVYRRTFCLQIHTKIPEYHAWDGLRSPTFTGK